LFGLGQSRARERDEIGVGFDDANAHVASVEM
jgi:hypothetical protein